MPRCCSWRQQGYRVIARDRRSHGRSDQTWDGNHMDIYADDLAELIAALAGAVRVPQRRD
jgi:pimeloyl-ACP methyl ester carboxylesterase